MSGDYQTKARMQQKLRAIPIPADLTGLSVLDLGMDHGEFCRIASERGAERVVGVDRGRGVRGQGFVDLVARNRKQGWPRCEFQYANLGIEWPDFGRFDLVFCFSLYHHVYGQTGDHDVIWKYLRSCVKDTGTLLWEGPWDVKDAIARKRAEPHGGYTKEAFLKAASQYFDVEYIGPGLHRPHRYVIRCTPKSPDVGIIGGDDDHRNGLRGDGEGQSGVHPEQPGTGNTGGFRYHPVPGNAEPEGGGSTSGGGVVRGTVLPVRTRVEDRSAKVVARQPPPKRPNRAGATRKGVEVQRRVPGTGRGRETEAVPVHRGPYTGEPAVILGGGQCVWEDLSNLETALGFEWRWTIIVVNDLGCVFPRRIDHWCTLHPEKLQKWEALRRENGHPDGYLTWSRQSRLVARSIKTRGGASGMLGATVARDGLGSRLGILCGVPMDKTPHFEQSVVHVKGRPWQSADAHWKAWKTADNKAWLFDNGWLKSMSGKTKDYLGAPDEAYLQTLRDLNREAA